MWGEAGETFLGVGEGLVRIFDLTVRMIHSHGMRLVSLVSVLVSLVSPVSVVRGCCCQKCWCVGFS